jgi:hypothetical protein
LTATDRPIGDRPARVVFALLVLACFAAFFMTQRLKHSPTAVQLFKLTPFFSPTLARHRQERISFRLARSDEVTVTIVDSAGSEVATLARGRPVARYKPFKLRWNGRVGTSSNGPLAPAGKYHVHVSLREQHRSVFSPRSFTLIGP